MPVALFLAAGIALTGCKPSERNYKSAYDVARAKAEREERERSELNREMGLSDATLQEVDGARLETVAGRPSVWGKRTRLARADSVAEYSVAIATFKMPANAEALAADMRGAGFSASRTAKQGERYYTLIGESPDPAEMVLLMERFEKKYKEYHYVGQPGIMLIINSAR